MYIFYTCSCLRRWVGKLYILLWTFLLGLSEQWEFWIKLGSQYVFSLFSGLSSIFFKTHTVVFFIYIIHKITYAIKKLIRRRRCTGRSYLLTQSAIGQKASARGTITSGEPIWLVGTPSPYYNAFIPKNAYLNNMKNNNTVFVLKKGLRIVKIDWTTKLTT